MTDLIGVEDVRAWRDKHTLALKRAIVEILMLVAIKPIGHDKRPRTDEQVLETLEITPKS